MRFIIRLLIDFPERIAAHFFWLGPLLARLVVGYVFLLTGWYKLNHLPDFIPKFMQWNIPYADVLTPLVSGIEFFGAIFLIIGLFTRISAGALAVVMAVAIISAKFSQIDSLQTLLGFEEASYFVIFTWLAIDGAGKVSLDYWLERKFMDRPPSENL
jgi:putative oxidoreductase